MHPSTPPIHLSLRSSPELMWLPGLPEYKLVQPQGLCICCPPPCLELHFLYLLFYSSVKSLSSSQIGSLS